MKKLFAFFLVGSLLIGCNSIPSQSMTAVSTAIVSTQFIPISGFTQFPAPSPTVVPSTPGSARGSNEFCKPPSAILPVEDGNDISENEIVYELLESWLRRYKSPEAPAFCRLAEYSIEKVYDDPTIYSKDLEPRGDFKRVVVFSVKPVQVSSDWMSFTGELDQDSWLHNSHIVAITETGGGYTLAFAYP